jgi:hypothetical protein
MIDLKSEQLLSLAEAAQRLPRGRGGRPTHFSTILRWILTGVRGPADEKVKLEAIRLGDRWLTSAEALQRFAEALTPKSEAPPTLRSPARRERAAARAGAALEAAGI